MEFFFLSGFFFLLLLVSVVVVGRSGWRGSDGRTFGPRHHPIIGCMIDFCKNSHRTLDWYTSLLKDSPTNTIVVWRFGIRQNIVTANQENVEYILKTNFQNYPKGEPLKEHFRDLLGTGIFNVDGEMWFKQRKLASHEFTMKYLRDTLVKSLQSETENRLLPLLKTAMENSSVIDMQEVLTRFGFDVICDISFGYDLGLLKNGLPTSEFASAYVTASEICIERTRGIFFPAGWKVKRFFCIGLERILRDKVRIIHQTIEDLIKKRIDDEYKTKLIDGGRNDFLSRLISSGNSIEATRDMVISFILAGRDTTSSALTWFFYLITLHPNIQTLILKESFDLTGEKSLTNIYQNLKEMKFLEAALMESMRLYPPVSMDSKHAVSSDVLPDGTLVGKGDRVTFFPYGMGRMEKLWGKNWSEFDPYRWLTVSEEKKKELAWVSPYKFPVFQAGPRICLGKEMAIIQMKYVAVSVLREFELRRTTDEIPTFIPMMTSQMSGGFNVLFNKRY
ncbi:hypothetical protein ZOSMA_237G00200 [Zostera marina]|uniref:Cytochrome P450 n=1 Tax=Zostera marina TaxID=29655 RepID=A0A0K9PHU9_ZOSMR|nr:hypothetical protein ZOSMA_237G00200 [Zostera marina]